jgi:hypothetical protein
MKLLMSPLVLVGVASAATLLVPGQYPTIQSAIIAAVDGDTVQVSAGTYEGTVNFQGKNIVVWSPAGPGLTLIRTFREYYCVVFNSGEDSTAVLEGFRLLNQMTDNPEPDRGASNGGDYGGGIYIEGSSPTIRGNILDGCKPEGGAIYARYSSSLIEQNEIKNSYNCGIYALYLGAAGPIRIVGNLISGNNAQYGGGIRLNDAWAEIIGNEISGNLASTDGGGILVSGDSVLICSNIVVNNHTSHEGGGINVYQCNVQIGNNLITQNVASSDGGIACDNSEYVILYNNNIVNNMASDDGYITGGTGITQCQEVYILNSIIWNNNAPSGSAPNLLVYDSFTEVSYSDIGGGLDSVWVDSSSTLIWGPGNIDADPLFESGPFGDYHLSSGSPCIDAGNPDPQYYDPEDPFNPGYALWPAMGLLRNDMGAFGGGGVGYWLGIEEEASPPLQRELLLRSFPNPFSSCCTVCFRLPESAYASLEVYDLSGRLVSTLLDQQVPADGYTAWFDGTGLPSGTYILLLRAGDLTASRRCVLVR